MLCATLRALCYAHTLPLSAVSETPEKLGAQLVLPRAALCALCSLLVHYTLDSAGGQAG